MTDLLVRLVRSEDGQDLIEYALLTAATGFAGLAAWPAVVNSLGIVYVTLDTQTQELWEPPNPIGGGGSP